MWDAFFLFKEQTIITFQLMNWHKKRISTTQYKLLIAHGCVEDIGYIWIYRWKQV